MIVALPDGRSDRTGFYRGIRKPSGWAGRGAGGGWDAFFRFWEKTRCFDFSPAILVLVFLIPVPARLCDWPSQAPLQEWNRQPSTLPIGCWKYSGWAISVKSSVNSNPDQRASTGEGRGRCATDCEWFSLKLFLVCFAFSFALAAAELRVRSADFACQPVGDDFVQSRSHPANCLAVWIWTPVAVFIIRQPISRRDRLADAADRFFDVVFDYQGVLQWAMIPVTELTPLASQ